MDGSYENATNFAFLSQCIKISLDMSVNASRHLKFLHSEIYGMVSLLCMAAGLAGGLMCMFALLPRPTSGFLTVRLQF